MATITVQDVDDDVLRRLRQRAAANGRSLEAEARDPDSGGRPPGTRRGLGRRHPRTPRRRAPDPPALRAARGRPGMIVLDTDVLSQSLQQDGRGRVPSSTALDETLAPAAPPPDP